MPFLYSHWLSISLSDRAQLAHKLGIKKVRSTHVSNNVVVDDGYNIKDIEDKLTIESLQGITGSTSTDTKVLLDEAVRGLQPIGKMEIVVTPEFANKKQAEIFGKALASDIIKKKRGRPKLIK